MSDEMSDDMALIQQVRAGLPKNMPLDEIAANIYPAFQAHIFAKKKAADAKAAHLRQRVLTLAREMMLSDAAHGNGVKAAPYHFEDYTISASAWIRYEDAYVLPEDMQ